MLTRLRRALLSLRHNPLPRRLVRPTRLFNRTRRTTLQNRTFPSLLIRPLYGTIRPNLQFRPRNRLGKHGTIMRNVQRPRHHTNINNVTMRGIVLFRVPLHYLTNRPRRNTRKLRTLLLHRVRGTFPIRPRPLRVKHTLISLRRILLRIINRLTLQMTNRRLFRVVKQIENGNLTRGANIKTRITMRLRRRNRGKHTTPTVNRRIRPIRVSHIPLVTRQRRVVIHLLKSL